MNAALLLGQSPQGKQLESAAPIPSARIQLSAVGYSPPPRLDRLIEDESSVSLDFVDAGHILLTFNPRKLFHRDPSCPPGHQDRLMHAVILELPSGKIVREVDWYLHDRGRYLWPLSPGKFLLRRLNDLYIVDSQLQEHLLLSSSKDLLWVAVTPDAGQIIIETARDPDIVKPGLSPHEPAKHGAKFVAQFLDAQTLEPRRTVPLNKIVDLTGTSAGYVDLIQKGEIWLIRFGSSPTQRRNLARVRSRTVPDVFYAGNNSLLIGRCASTGCDYGVTSFALTGRRLWQQHWSRYRYFPAVARTEDDSRFAVSTLHHAPLDNSEPRPGSPQFDPDDAFQTELSQRDNFQQEVQIFETASGSPILSLKASPAVLSGQNVSLSPDGRRLAVLQGDALELFDLAQTSSEELAKSSVLKTEVPDLYALAEASDADAPQDATATAAIDKADQPQPEDSSASSSENPEDSASLPPPTALTEKELDAITGPTTTFKVSARSVVVDIVVTDSKGHPVRGLPQQDFQLVEDGKPQEVRSFHEFSDADEPAAAPTPPASTKPNPNVFTNNTYTPDPGAVTLILFDMLNTPSQDQVYARQQLIKFLQTKPKGSQFALCTLSSGGKSTAATLTGTSHLRLLQGFTPDETLLLAAARGNKSVPQDARWQGSASETRNAVGIVGDLAQGGRMSGFQNLLGALQGMQAEQVGTDTDERVAITTDSLMVLARYLAGIPGRKNLLWLSSAFPVSIAAPTGANDSAGGNRNYSEKIRTVTNLLGDAQVAIYPIDVRGLQGGGPAAENILAMAGPNVPLAATSSARILAPENTAAPSGLFEMDQQTAERNTLTEFATATGGKAFYNSNGIKDAIATAAEQGSNYYSLSYSPANKIYNGKFRRIKVQLAGKGHSLHYRQGYFAEDANAAGDADLSRRVRAAAMQHGSPPSRQILFAAKVALTGPKRKMNPTQIGEVPPGPAKKPASPGNVDVQHYTIDYTFQGSQLHFIPLENSTFRNVLTLMAASFDGEGTMLTAVSRLGVSNLEPALYKNVIGGEFQLHQEVDVPVRATSLRLGIQDQMSNHLGTIEIPLPVPPSPDTPRKVKHPLPPVEPD